MHTYAKFATRVENILRRIFFGRIVYFYAYQIRIFFSKRVDNRIFYFYTFQPLAPHDSQTSHLPMHHETPPYLARRGIWLLSPKTLVRGFQSRRRSRRAKPDPLGGARGRARFSATATRRRTSRAKTVTPRPRAVAGDIH